MLKLHYDVCVDQSATVKTEKTSTTNLLNNNDKKAETADSYGIEPDGFVVRPFRDNVVCRLIGHTGCFKVVNQAEPFQGKIEKFLDPFSKVIL